jgi:AcrR family transcriptional regulator
VRSPTKPDRGTRPANRRDLILAAAEDLFYRNGFANVGMSDIAEAVATGPSALYRHFGSKNELLATVVNNVLDSTEKMLTASEPRTGQLAANIAVEMLEHRAVGVLWRRESRNLPTETRTAIRSRIRDVTAQLSRLIGAARPALGPAEADFLGWCALGAASSVSFHGLRVPDGQFASLLAALVAAVIGFDMPTLIDSLPDGVTRPTTLTSGVSRREALLTAAAKLFADHGFANVGIEDIGAAVGIAGPSVYHHFPTKADVLVAAMLRGDSWLQMDMSRVLGRADGPADGLQRLLRSYTDFSFEFPHLVQLLITEIVQLPAKDQHRMRARQHEYIAEWVQLLRSLHPQLNPTNARIRVQAALNMINDIALTPHLHRYQNLAPALVDIGAGLLTEGI